MFHPRGSDSQVDAELREVGGCAASATATPTAFTLRAACACFAPQEAEEEPQSIDYDLSWDLANVSAPLLPEWTQERLGECRAVAAVPRANLGHAPDAVDFLNGGDVFCDDDGPIALPKAYRVRAGDRAAASSFSHPPPAPAA